jgi:hypothetical protein
MAFPDVKTGLKQKHNAGWHGDPGIRRYVTEGVAITVTGLVLSYFVWLGVSVQSLQYKAGQNSESIAKLEDKVGALDNRVGALDNRLGQLEVKVDMMIQHLGAISEKLDQVLMKM